MIHTAPCGGVHQAFIPAENQLSPHRNKELKPAWGHWYWLGNKLGIRKLTLGFFVFCLSSLSVRCGVSDAPSSRFVRARARARGRRSAGRIVTTTHTHRTISVLDVYKIRHTIVRPSPARRSTPRPIARAQHQNTARARPIARRSARASIARSDRRDRRGESVRREMDAEARGGDARARSSASASSYGTHATGRTMMMMPPTTTRAMASDGGADAARRGERGEELTSRATRSARR